MEMNINEIERLFLLEDIVKITKTQADIDNY